MVTTMEMRMRTMMIHVWSGQKVSLLRDDGFGVGWEAAGEGRGDSREVRLSAMESESISARSRKTRQRSLRTWIRGLISRYSRTAMYSG